MMKGGRNRASIEAGAAMIATVSTAKHDDQQNYRETKLGRLVSTGLAPRLGERDIGIHDSGLAARST